MSYRFSRHMVMLLGVSLSVTACKPAQDESKALNEWPEAQFSEAGEIPEYPQRPGDPERGRKALLEESYVECGLPERVFRELLGDQPIVEAPDRTSRAKGLPFASNVFTNELGVSVVSSNCLTCHGTVLFGDLVPGLGNEFLDFTGDASTRVERAGALVKGGPESETWQLYADRIAAIAPYIRTRTVGSNPANNLTFALIAHRDAKTNAWSEQALLPLPPREPPPVSVPPWWRMAKKNAMFNMGEGRGDHARIMMSASMLCTDTIEALEAIDAYAPDIRAYIDSLRPPEWPFAIDAKLAGQGRQVFTASCSRCHGNYGGQLAESDSGRDQPASHYPNSLVPIDEIGTDATLIELAQNQGQAYLDWFQRSYYGELTNLSPAPGYVAPPLDGIWATAPYLHNGSVPSLRTLLDSTTRAQIWRHQATDASDPETYDTVNLGWRYDRISAEAYSSSAQTDARVFDTREPGHANSGHLFGDSLSDADRTAVIEYLKTL